MTRVETKREQVGVGMKGVAMGPQRSNYWHYDVLADLASALHRDGLPETAEMIEDALAVLLNEISRLNAEDRTREGGVGLDTVPLRVYTRQ